VGLRLSLLTGRGSSTLLPTKNLTGVLPIVREFPICWQHWFPLSVFSWITLSHRRTQIKYRDSDRRNWTQWAIGTCRGGVPGKRTEVLSTESFLSFICSSLTDSMGFFLFLYLHGNLLSSSSFRSDSPAMGGRTLCVVESRCYSWDIVTSPILAPAFAVGTLPLVVVAVQGAPHMPYLRSKASVSCGLSGS